MFGITATQRSHRLVAGWSCLVRHLPKSPAKRFGLGRNDVRVRRKGGHCLVFSTTQVPRAAVDRQASICVCSQPGCHLTHQPGRYLRSRESFPFLKIYFLFSKKLLRKMREGKWKRDEKIHWYELFFKWQKPSSKLFDKWGFTCTLLLSNLWTSSGLATNTKVFIVISPHYFEVHKKENLNSRLAKQFS